MLHWRRAGTGPPGGQPEAPDCTNPSGCPDNRVILVDRDGNIVWQYGQFGVGGSGFDQLNVPVQNTWLPNRHVLITDQANERVIEVDVATNMPKLMAALIQQCATAKKPTDHLFTRDGVPVRDFRHAWADVTEEAGVPDLLFHDLRRTAVRNMIRRGIPQHVAMKISGHKTDSVFRRYAIVSPTDLAEAAAKMNEKPDSILTVDVQPAVGSPLTH